MLLASHSERGLRRHAWLGLLAIAIFVVGLGGWATSTQIAGAVIASGTLVLQEGSKRVQHPEGGVVEEILVEDGDPVEAGQLLLRLEGTTAQANHAVIVSQLTEAFAMQARLLAESTGATELVRQPALADWPAKAELERLLAVQEQLRQSRAAARRGYREQLEEQVSQLEEQITGLEAQRSAAAKELEILLDEGEDVEELLEQGLVQATRLNTIRRDAARLEGEQGRLAAAIATARMAISERRAQIAQVDDEFQSQVLEEQRAVGLQIAELLQQKIAAEDRLGRLEIRAPQAGVVHESVVRTVGGVVGAGETLMLIVPQSSAVVVEARVTPFDIDKLRVGQPVAVRLSGFDPRTTPELAAEIVSISPDLSRDPTTGTPFYTVRIGLDDSQLQRLPEEQNLVPGMPVEAFMRTGDRTVLSYLVEPLAVQVRRAFRED
jgi:HlyD family secretion protein